ncbi:MAG TPA: hypothetical protein VMX55_12270 [candidate division Zixibacteria bacterium]|nr:hypothetical protein [candidate division Zixibacteria bacterium]
MNIKNLDNNLPLSNDNNLISENISRKKGYTTGEWVVIALTIIITLLGILLRVWRILREGMPIGFDGYYYLRYIKSDFLKGWIDLSEITRDPPGFTFIIIIAELLFGYSGIPMVWSIYIFPQVVSALQLLIFFVLARRLGQSRMIGLLSMFYMSFLGMIVYRNQNIAPETFVLGLVPFVVFYILRYLETVDYRFMITAILITLAIIMIHHLTTLIVLIIWHILFLYDVIYRHIKNNNSKKKTQKNIIFDALVIVILDVFVFVFWKIVLKGFPLNFISDSFGSLFPEGEPIWTSILIIVAVVIINIIAFALFFYNFSKKKLNNVIITTSIVGVGVIFVVAMFYGAASPDQNISSALLMGTQAIVLVPMGVYGLVALPENNQTRSRIMRGWIYAIILIVSLTAIFPLMSSFLGRLALYLAAVGLVLSAFGIAKIIKKINTRKLKAIGLIALTGFMGLTMCYSYPTAENNWGTQEVFWEAEFSTVDFFIVYVDTQNQTIWSNLGEIKVDTDFRFAAILEGISGVDSVFDNSGYSWLRKTLYSNESELFDFVTTVTPHSLNQKIDYIVITEAMIRDGFMTGWASYAEDNDNWVKKFPNVTAMIPLNPGIHRIYDTKISIILIPNLI